MIFLLFLIMMMIIIIIMIIIIVCSRKAKIAKCLSQLGMEKRKNRKMSISIRYGKT